MCREQNLPHSQRTNHIRRVLASAGNADNEDHDRIQRMIEGPMPSYETIEAYNFQVQRVLPTLTPDQVHGRLVNGFRQLVDYTLSSDYELIFSKIFERQVNRPTSTYPCSCECGTYTFVEEWLKDCYDLPGNKYDLDVMGDMEPFEHFLKDHLPTKLDLDSWVARRLLDDIDVKINDSVAEYEIWDPWMAEAGLPSYLILGKGRLVWMPVKSRTTQPNKEKIAEEVRRTEQTLVDLARRIANYVAYCVIEDFVKPHTIRAGRRILSFTQLYRAVKEILGGEWFDLPFDVDGRLKTWGHKGNGIPVGNGAEELQRLFVAE